MLITIVKVLIGARANLSFCAVAMTMSSFALRRASKAGRKLVLLSCIGWWAAKGIAKTII